MPQGTQDSIWMQHTYAWGMEEALKKGTVDAAAAKTGYESQLERAKADIENYKARFDQVWLACGRYRPAGLHRAHPVSLPVPPPSARTTVTFAKRSTDT